MAQGTASPPPSVLTINLLKEQHFSKMAGGEIAVQSDNNVYFGAWGWF